MTHHVRRHLTLLSIAVVRAFSDSCCNLLQHTATHCNTLQHIATHCNTLHLNAPPQQLSTSVKLHVYACEILRSISHCNTLQHTATHCNTLQHTATHYNTLHHTTTVSIPAIDSLIEFYCVLCRGGAGFLNTHCNTLQHTAT